MKKEGGGCRVRPEDRSTPGGSVCWSCPGACSFGNTEGLGLEDALPSLRDLTVLVTLTVSEISLRQALLLWRNAVRHSFSGKPRACVLDGRTGLGQGGRLGGYDAVSGPAPNLLLHRRRPTRSSAFNSPPLVRDEKVSVGHCGDSPAENCLRGRRRPPWSPRHQQSGGRAEVARTSSTPAETPG